MKRVGNLYHKISTYENLSLAIDNAVRHKNKKFKSVRRLIEHKDYYIIKLQKMLYTFDINLGENRTFTITQKNGKVRDITAPKLFPNQVIQWAVMQVISPIFMKSMYYYSIGSIPKRGGLMGKKYIEKIYRKDKSIRYILKLDIKKFYPSIDHDKLKALLRRKFKDEQLLKLLDLIIDSGGEKGLPIGYYSSQWLANFYLTNLDHYIKEELHIKYYIRYVDDMVLIDTNKRKLGKAKQAIDYYFKKNNYKVVIKDNWQKWKIHTRPLDFLGYKFYESNTYLRKSLYLTICRSVEKLKQKGFLTIKRAFSLTSLFGWLKHIKEKGRRIYNYYIKDSASKHILTSMISIYATN